MHTYSLILRAGDFGDAPVVAGKPEASNLLHLVNSNDVEERMPKLDDPLSGHEKSVLRKWIQEGARFDGKHKDVPYVEQLPPRVHPKPPQLYRRALPVNALSFSKDGKQLAVGGFHEVLIWDVESGNLAGRLEGMPERIVSLEYRRDGQQLLVAGGSAGEYGEALVVDLPTSKPQVLGIFTDMLMDASYSPDGRFVAAGCANRKLKYFDVKTKTALWELRVHSDWVTGVAVSEDGKYVTSASRDLTVKVYDASAGKLFTTYNGHQKQYGKYTGRFPVFDVTFSQGTDQAFSAGAGSVVRIWNPTKAKLENGDASDMENRFAKEGHTTYIEHKHSGVVLRMAAFKNHLFTAGEDGNVHRFDVPSAKQDGAYEGDGTFAFSISYHSPTKMLAFGTYAGNIYLVDTKNGQQVRRWIGVPTETKAAAKPRAQPK